MKKLFPITGLRVAIVLIFAVSCSEPAEKEDNSVLLQTEFAEDTPEAGGKTDVENAIEAAKAIIDARNDILDTKRRRDSTRLARREKMFAYQLGLSFRNKQLAIEAYKRLSDAEGVRVLKKSKKEYLLIKFDDRDEDLLKAELENYIDEHGDEVTGTVKIIDLVRECGRNKKPVQDENITEKRGTISIECLTCNSE